MKSSPFQIIVIAIFGVFIVGAFIALFLTKAGNANKSAVEISLWGSVSSGRISAMSEALGLEKQGLKIAYKEIPADTFGQQLIEALASGRGPDSIIVSQDSISKYQDKVYPIPYQTFGERAYKDTYVSEAELFLSPWGVLSIPFSIDPMVTYWNRDTFSSAGISTPPKYWTEFPRLAEFLTKKSDSVSIAKSAVGIGEFSNINNAKEIIGAMAMQTGANFTARDTEGKLVNTIGQKGDLTSVVDFYTEFANPVKSVYTWSRALPNSQDMFARGDLAVYFGFGSELNKIKTKNPNLDFDLTYFPQPQDASTKMTAGQVLGISVIRWSSKADSAIKLALLFGSQGGVKVWSEMTGLPPVRREFLKARPSDAYGAILYDSALWSRGWLDPDYNRTKNLFRDMIESVTSGWLSSGESVRKFGAQLTNMLSGQ